MLQHLLQVSNVFEVNLSNKPFVVITIVSPQRKTRERFGIELRVFTDECTCCMMQTSIFDVEDGCY